MEIIRKKMPKGLQEHAEYYTLKEYYEEDIVDYDGSLRKRKASVVDRILRPRIKHVPFKDLYESRVRVMKRMARKVLVLYANEIVEELFAGNKVEIHKYGTLEFRTKPFVPSYRGKKKDYIRAKEKGFYTMIHTELKFPVSRLRNGPVYVSLSQKYKERLHDIEDDGLKY